MSEPTSNAPLTVVLVHGAFADSLSSHVIMISRPDVDAEVIKTAAEAVSRPVAAVSD